MVRDRLWELVCSLHKWLAAPPGTGFLYVRRERIADRYPLFGARSKDANDIRKFEQTGTHAVAPFVAIGKAIDFYESIGVGRKSARLHYLKQYWTDQIKSEPKVIFHTPLDRKNSCAMVHVEVEGVDARKLSEHMRDRERIFVYPITREGEDGGERLNGVYVAPNVFTRPAELDLFVEALCKVARRGLPVA